METKKSKIPSQVVSIIVNDVHACIDLQSVIKIIFIPQLEYMPTDLKYIVGLMNYEGRSIPVIDLAVRLNMARNQPYSVLTPLILCNKDSHQVGIIVDKIGNISHINKDSVQVSQEFREQESMFDASIIVNNQVLLLVNMDKLIQSKILFENMVMNGVKQ